MVGLTKGLLMPALALVVWCNPALRNRSWLWVALFASWVGDVCLVFPGQTWFLAGLGSFFVAHLAYIRGLSSRHSGQPALLRRYPWLVLPYAGFYAALFAIIYPGLGDMAIPVAVYALVICLMSLIALNRFGRVSQASFRWVWVGSVSFLASDSIIATESFGPEWIAIPFPDSWIMLLYLLAQGIIVYGLEADQDPFAPASG